MARNDVLARLAVLITANNAEFGAVMSQSSSQAKAFQNAINGLNGTLKTIGIGFGIKQVIDGIKDAIGTAAQFEHTMSTVKAITGEAGEGFKELEENAKSLGRSTQFTADQVGQLQVAYGRLGFTKNEILAATSATLDLAAATGEDLAKSADVAGSIIRGFNLNANQTQRIVDVMASSFNRTALGLENFSEAIKYVAPIAANAGISIEETTALLGTLADAGIRGSQAGTSLRKIITDLGTGTGTLSEKLKALADKGLTGAEAMSEVGRTAYASLLVLAENTKKTEEAAKAYGDVAGASKAAALVLNDDLIGATTKMTSAYDGLIIAIAKTKFIKGEVEDLTYILNSLSGTGDSIDTVVDHLAKYIDTPKIVDNLTEKLKILRQELGKNIEAPQVNFLIDKYKLTSEEADKFRTIIGEVNKSLSFNERALAQFSSFVDRNTSYDYKNLKKAAQDYIDSLNKQLEKEKEAKDLRDQQIKTTGSSIFSDNSKNISDLQRIIELIKQTYLEVRKGEKEVKIIPKGLIEQAEEDLKKFKKAQTEAFTIDAIRYFENLIQETEARLKSLKESLPFNERRTEALPTNISAEVPKLSGQQFLIDIGVSKDAIHSINETADALDNVKIKAVEVEEKFINIGHAISNGIANAVSDMAYTLGEALSGNGGVENFGKAILKAVIGFAKQLGEILVAAGFAALAAKQLIKNPYTAIAGGIALLAVAGAASAALNASQSSYNGGNSGFQTGSTQKFQTSTQTMQLELTGKFNISGNDLALTLSNQNIRDQRIKPG
jgi:TP901 family phage tail tape measure protein